MPGTRAEPAGRAGEVFNSLSVSPTEVQWRGGGRRRDGDYDEGWMVVGGIARLIERLETRRTAVVDVCAVTE